MPVSTRRDFLATTSLALTGVALGARSMSASSLPASIFRSGKVVQSFMSEPMLPSTFQSMAAAAVEGARGAGASYADVRVGEQHYVRIFPGPNPLTCDLTLHVTFTYGIRVLADGRWAFAHGTVPDQDALVVAARDAVATARGYGQIRQDPIELAPTPVVTGTWTSPVKIDPFTVPVEEQLALLYDFRTASDRTLGAGSAAAFQWTRDTRVFASTEGSMVTQTVYRARPQSGGNGLSAFGQRGMGNVTIPIIDSMTGTGGYERVLVPGTLEQLKAASEEAVRLARLVRRPMDVGRYPVVFDGGALAKVVAATIGPALDLDRVLGYEADASGTSFLSPVTEVLAAPIFSPLLSVNAGRSMPSLHAVGWDDEGVAPQQYPVIANGRVVDFHTSRQTAPALREWYAKQGKPLRSNGCAVAPMPSHSVMVRTPHLTIAPNTTATSLDDLCREISRGLLVRNIAGISADQQYVSASISMAEMYAIERGQIVRRVHQNMLAFSARTFWKSLSALGDASTLQSSTDLAFKGQPWTYTENTATAPAGFVKDVNVVATPH